MNKIELNYRMAVNKALTFHHFEIEAGLRRAHEQESFINKITNKLLSLNLSAHLCLDKQFNVTFYISTTDIAHTKMQIAGALDAIANIEADGTMLYASNKYHDYLSCAIAFVCE